MAKAERARRSTEGSAMLIVRLEGEEYCSRRSIKGVGPQAVRKKALRIQSRIPRSIGPQERNTPMARTQTTMFPVIMTARTAVMLNRQKNSRRSRQFIRVAGTQSAYPVWNCMIRPPSSPMKSEGTAMISRLFRFTARKSRVRLRGRLWKKSVCCRCCRYRNPEKDRIIAVTGSRKQNSGFPAETQESQEAWRLRRVRKRIISCAMSSLKVPACSGEKAAEALSSADTGYRKKKRSRERAADQRRRFMFSRKRSENELFNVIALHLRFTDKDLLKGERYQFHKDRVMLLHSGKHLFLPAAHSEGQEASPLL